VPCLRLSGVPRGSVLRRLAHVPLGWRATILHVRIRRYRCSGCGQAWRQDTTAAAAPRAKLPAQAGLWALKSVIIARIAAGPGVSWHTVNDAALAAGRQLPIADPARFDGAQVPGADEHARRRTRRGDKFVTVIMPPTRPARHLRAPRPDCPS
jgi:transposase